jgi:predicted CXXCH cytochrome family protein
VDQLALYANSVHGKQLAAGQSKSAQCVDCHGVHDIRAVSDPLSPVNPRQVTKTCAKCHASEAEQFRASPHARRFASARRPGCVACHASHAIEPAGIAMLTGKENVCARCHDAASAAGRAAAQIADLLASLEAAGPESRPALDRARRAVHTANFAAVKRAAEATPPSSRPAAEMNPQQP